MLHISFFLRTFAALKMNYQFQKYTSMRKIFLSLLLAVMAGMTVSAANLDFGDRFAFAGLESAKLVPPTGVEILERQVPVRNMDQRPIKDAVYVYIGEEKGTVSVSQMNAYSAQVFQACKAASNDGKVYKEPSYGDTKLMGELTEPKVFEKAYGTAKYLIKHGDRWFTVHVGYGSDYGGSVWVKNLPEKFYCWTIYVREYFIDE